MADRPQDRVAGAGDNRPRLSLHVPEPKFRPGDTVDFSHIEVPEAGAQSRPDETSDPKDMLDFAHGLTRRMAPGIQSSIPKHFAACWATWR